MKNVGAGIPTVVVGMAGKIRILDHPWVRRMSFDDLLNLIASNDLSYKPPTRVNLAEEKERADREERL